MLGEGEPEDGAGNLGSLRIQTTLDLYTDEDLDEMIAAQEKFLDGVGFEVGSVQSRAWVSLWVSSFLFERIRSTSECSIIIDCLDAY